MSTRTLPTRALRASAELDYFDTADVVIVGLGAAGASAAIEAAAAGCDVLVLEVASAGGGTTALAGFAANQIAGMTTQRGTGHPHAGHRQRPERRPGAGADLRRGQSRAP